MARITKWTFGVAALALLACSAGDESADANGSDLVTTAPNPPVGLMMRSGTPPTSEESFMTSSVSMVNWSDLQPSATTENWSTLDNSLAQLHAAGITRVRLRIMSGGHAPVWVKRLGAPNASAPWFQGTVPTSVIDCSNNGEGGGVAAQNIQGAAACVPFIWTQKYLTAYQDLMTHVRAHLDALDTATHAPVSTVVDSACMVVYAEVFYRGQGLGYTNQTLFEAGLTHTADVNCQKTAITIHKSVFGATRRTSVAINNWDVPQGTPGPHNDYRTTIWSDGGATFGAYDFAEWARQQLDFGNGTLLEVQNNGLHTNSQCDGSGPTGSYFCYIAQYAGRHGFQTQSYEPTPHSASGASLTLLQDLDNGLAMHAQYIELPSGMSAADWTLMACYDKHLRSGDSSPCPH